MLKLFRIVKRPCGPLAFCVCSFIVAFLVLVIHMIGRRARKHPLVILEGNSHLSKSVLLDTDQGIIQYSNAMLPEVANASRFLDYLTIEDAQLLFHRYVTYRDIFCMELDRVGDVIEGGYEICLMDSYKLEPGSCLVYSFGVGDNWSFDDGMREKYNCEVHSFDPTINMTSHKRADNHYFHDYGIWGDERTTEEGWHLLPLSKIKERLGHSNSVIDILKLDVEGAEWSSLRHMIDHEETTAIKQVVMEIHAPRFRQSHDKVTTRDFGAMFEILMGLQRVGFRKYLNHYDKYCCSGFADLVPYSIAKKLLCCYELFLINTNYLEAFNSY